MNPYFTTLWERILQDIDIFAEEIFILTYEVRIENSRTDASTLVVHTIDIHAVGNSVALTLNVPFVIPTMLMTAP